MRHIIKTPFSENNHAGFSLIEALLAIGVVGIVAVGISSGITYSKRSQKSLEAKQSSTQFQESFRGAISRAARKFMTDKCVGTSTFGCSPPPPRGVIACAVLADGSGGGGSADMLDPGAGGGGGPSISGKSPVELFFSDVPLGDGATMSFSKNITALADSQREVASRCASPILGEREGGKIGKGEFYRFCVNLKPPTNKEFGSDSFWSQGSAFAEIIIIPVKLPSDEPLMCKEVTSSGEGAKVIFSIHFVSKKGTTPVPGGAPKTVYTGHRNNGVFYVSVQ
jgi:type II secretory pathway pseudopilin PulG